MEPRRSKKSLRRFRFWVTVACLSLTGCAAAARLDHGLPPERLAQLHGICADTMQISPGYVHFEDCMDVLSETARRVDRARAQP
jgi:hypothetical protein